MLTPTPRLQGQIVDIQASELPDHAPTWDEIRDVPLPEGFPPGVGEDLKLQMRQFLYRWLWRGEPAVVGGELLALCEAFAEETCRLHPPSE